MPIIGFDALIYAYPAGGIAHYQTQLMQALTRENDMRLAFAGGFALQRHVAPPTMKSPPLGQRHLLFTVNLARATGLRSDVHHLTAFWRPPFLKTRRTVVTVHDMIPEKLGIIYPSIRRNHYAKHRLAKAADVVITPSETARADAIELLRLSPERVFAIPHGSPVMAKPEPSPKAGEGWFAQNSGRYVLVIGRRGHYKNFIGIVPGLGDAMAGRKDMTLFCVGGGPFSPAEREALRKAGILDRAVQRALSAPDLALAYRNALAVIAPSIAEGFGFPVLEAMAHGTPVIASDIPVHREVAGDAALWFDPVERDSFSDGLKQLIGSDTARLRYSAAGRAQSERYTWEKTAQATAALYRQIA